MDIQKYNIENYQKLLEDLKKYEQFVQSYNETKMVEGNKVPKRIYQIVILEPDAVDLDVIKAAKQQAIQEHIANNTSPSKEIKENNINEQDSDKEENK